MAVERAEILRMGREGLARLQSELDARERDLIEKRWLSEPPAPLRHVGRIHGITGERVRQIEGRLLARGRAVLASLAPAVAETGGTQ